MKRKLALLLSALALVILFALLAFSIGVFVGKNLLTASKQNTPTTTTVTTSSSSTTTTIIILIRNETTTTTIDVEDEARKNEAIIRASSKTFSPWQVLNVTCDGAGNKVTLWTDSVGFKVNVTNIGQEMGYIETSAMTNRGVNLTVDPALYNALPGETVEVSVNVMNKDVRNGDNITVTSEMSGKKRELTLHVERISDSYSDKSKSGLLGCGAAATYDKEH